MTWQPIETAPRDGTMALIYAAPHGDMRGFITVAAYNEWGGWCVCELREATHWMPLPAPPDTPANAVERAAGGGE